MKMMKLLLALLAGLVFGLGLILSGMTDPAKVIGFLDLAGNWDPSLGLVMGGAVLVGLVTFRFSARRTKAFLGDAMHIPTTRQIDRRLVLGGITFGVGWGLAGYCPGPALASLASSGFQALLFIAAMLAGMGLFALLEKR
ncbi:MAG: putative membrane protein YedE/YeeE [Bradyrhizobium sp.]|jgi:uncharacterized membrane protein YedE/YeeE